MTVLQSTTWQRSTRSFSCVALLLLSVCNRDASVARTDSAEIAKGGGDTAKTEAVEHGEEHEEQSDSITLSEAAYRTAQILVQQVGTTSAGTSTNVLEVPGQVELDPRRIALVSSRIGGRLERLAVVQGDRVATGQQVATLFSPEILTAQMELSQAVRRTRTLAGTSDEAGARAIEDAARQRLRIIGVSLREIERVASGGDAAATMALVSPMTGSIIEAHTLPGAAVDAGAPVFTVADLSVIDVIAEVPERSLPQVRSGQRAVVSIAAFPSMRFEGRVERLRDALNAETRTLRAVIHVPNRNGALRPGMFATVRLDVPNPDGVAGSPSDDLPLIPESAVVTDGERRFVFVETGPRTFERREVRTVPMSRAGGSPTRATMLIVQDGLRAGERVVIRGAFTLKSELSKSSLGDHH